MLFWPAWFSIYRLRLPALNPFTIALTATIPIDLMKLFLGPLYLMDDGLEGVSYQFAILMGNLYIASQLIAVLVAFRFSKSIGILKYLPLSKISLSNNDFKRIGIIYFLLFMVVFYLLASAEFGVLNWLSNPREGYQLYRVGHGQWYALAISFLAVSFLSFLLYCRRPLALVFTTFAFIVVSSMLGSKGIIIQYFLTGLIFLYFIKWRNLHVVLLIGLPLIFLLAIYNLYLAIGSDFDLSSIYSYFDYYKNAAMYYEAYFNNEIELFDGVVFITNLWGYVPRSLWPDKPYVWGVVNVVEYFYPGQAELTSTPAFGGAVEQFSDFGIPGVIFFGLINSQALFMGFASYILFSSPFKIHGYINVPTFLILLIQFGPMFGFFIPGLLYFILLALLTDSILLVKKNEGIMRRLV